MVKFIFSSHNKILFRQVLSFLVYYLLIWFFHLFLISIVSFFHFRLDHNLATVEEWIHDHGWDLVLITKLAVSALVFKFLYDDDIKKVVLKESDDVISCFEIGVILLFMLISVFILGGPYLSAHVDYYLVIRSFIGIFVFYMADVLFWYLIQLTFPIKKLKVTYFSMIIFSFMLFFSTKINFFKDFISWMTLLFIGFSLYLTLYGKLNLKYPLMFILLFICPISAFLGVDPIWGSKYSLFELEKPIGAINMLALLTVSFLYLVVKSMGIKKLFEYLSLKIFRRRFRWIMKD